MMALDVAAGIATCTLWIGSAALLLWIAWGMR